MVRRGRVEVVEGGGEEAVVGEVEEVIDGEGVGQCREPVQVHHEAFLVGAASSKSESEGEISSVERERRETDGRPPLTTTVHHRRSLSPAAGEKGKEN